METTFDYLRLCGALHNDFILLIRFFVIRFFRID